MPRPVCSSLHFLLRTRTAARDMGEGNFLAGNPMADVTLILERINHGDDGAMDQLIPLVYDELRRTAGAYMAAERAGHTLQATALVHEAFAKLVGGGRVAGWEGSRHFFNAAAEAMRQLLVDHARRRAAAKRGGGMGRVDLEGVDVPAPGEVDWQALDEALAELRKQDDRRYQVVMLRYFAGLPEHKVAQCLGLSEKTVQRDWKVARMFLLAQLTGEQQGARPAP